MEEQLAVDICWEKFAEKSFGEPLQKMRSSADEGFSSINSSKSHT